MTVPDPDRVARVLAALSSVGWQKNDLMQAPAILTEQGLQHRDLALLSSSYPLAILDVRMDLAAGRAPESMPVLHLVTNGAKTVVLGGDGKQEWPGVPAPGELKLALGLEPTDPRVADAAFESWLSFDQCLAVKAALDAFEGGSRRVRLDVPFGGGRSAILVVAIQKALTARLARRVLVAAPTRAELQQFLQRVDRNLWPTGWYGEPQRAGLQAITLANATSVYSPDPDIDLVVLPRLSDSQQIHKLLEAHESARFLAMGDDDAIAPVGLEVAVFQRSVRDLVRLTDATSSGPRIPLGEIAEVRPGTHIQNARTDTVGVLALTASGIGEDGTLDLNSARSVEFARDRLAAHLVRPGDVVIAHAGRTGRWRVAVAPAGVPPLVCHSTVVRIRLKLSTLTPEGLADWLRNSKELDYRAARSAGGLRFASASMLRDMLVPLRPELEERASGWSLARNGLLILRQHVVPLLEKLAQDAPQDTSTAGSELAAHLDNLARQFSPEPVSERVHHSFPSPISRAYARFLDARFNVFEQVLRLRDLAETIIHTVFAIAAADHRLRLGGRPEVADRRARRAWSSSSIAPRIGFVEAIFEASSEASPGLFVPELGKSSFVARANSLREFRNHLSHSSVATEARQVALLADKRPVVEALLADIEVLARYRLSRIRAQYRHNGLLVRQMQVWRGPVPFLEESPVDEELEEGGSSDLPDRDHLVLLNDGGEWLDLHPFLQVVESDLTGYQPHVCFLKERREGRLLGESTESAAEVPLPGVEALYAGD